MATRAATRKPSTTPRKRAAQDRSRATVDSLVEATARILTREGFAKASTNRIAEVAGVSVGSLYQYFPGKDALVAAVIDRHHDELMKTIRAALSKASSQTLTVGVRMIIAAAVEAHRIDPRLHRVLAEQIPRMGRLETVEVFNREAQGLFRSYLEQHSGELRCTDLDLASFICGATIEAVSHSAVLNHAAMPSQGTLEKVVDEATCMVVGYLQ